MSLGFRLSAKISFRLRLLSIRNSPTEYARETDRAQPLAELLFEAHEIAGRPAECLDLMGPPRKVRAYAAPWHEMVSEVCALVSS